MKQIYQLFAAATVVVVGATNLAARNWTPGSNAVPADQVKEYPVSSLGINEKV